MANHYVSFNNYASEFLDHMKKLYPDEDKIKEMHVYYEMSKMLDPRKPVSIFIEYLSDYGHQIMAKDEEFFKADQYVNKAQSLSGKMGLIERWESMSHDLKEKIWTYMQILYVSAMGALGKTADLHKIMQKLNEKKIK